MTAARNPSGITADRDAFRGGAQMTPRDLARFYASTWREGLPPILSAGALMLCAALLLEIWNG